MASIYAKQPLRKYGDTQYETVEDNETKLFAKLLEMYEDSDWNFEYFLECIELDGFSLLTIYNAIRRLEFNLGRMR